MNWEHVGSLRSTLIWLQAELREAKAASSALDAALSRMEPDSPNFDPAAPAPDLDALQAKLDDLHKNLTRARAMWASAQHWDEEDNDGP